MLSSEYVLSTIAIGTDASVAYGLEPGDTFQSVFNESNPKLVSVINMTVIGSGFALYRIPPVTLDATTQPASITNCNGASQTVVGDQLTIFGLFSE